jgi:hypothetical protein
MAEGQARAVEEQPARRVWMVPSLVPLLRHGEMVHLRVNERGEIVDLFRESREPTKGGAE